MIFIILIFCLFIESFGNGMTIPHNGKVYEGPPRCLSSNYFEVSEYRKENSPHQHGAVRIIADRVKQKVPENWAYLGPKDLAKPYWVKPTVFLTEIQREQLGFYGCSNGTYVFLQRRADPRDGSGAFLDGHWLEIETVKDLKEPLEKIAKMNDEEPHLLNRLLNSYEDNDNPQRREGYDEQGLHYGCEVGLSWAAAQLIGVRAGDLIRFAGQGVITIVIKKRKKKRKEKRKIIEYNKYLYTFRRTRG